MLPCFGTCCLAMKQVVLEGEPPSPQAVAPSSSLKRAGSYLGGQIYFGCFNQLGGWQGKGKRWNVLRHR